MGWPFATIGANTAKNVISPNQARPMMALGRRITWLHASAQKPRDCFTPWPWRAWMPVMASGVFDDPSLDIERTVSVCWTRLDQSKVMRGSASA